MLARAECETQIIMAITGHKTEAMVKHYEEADQNALLSRRHAGKVVLET